MDINSLMNAMILNGIVPTSPIELRSDRYYRFSTTGKRGDLSGWLIYLPEQALAVYGDWKTGAKYTYKFKDTIPSDLSALQILSYRLKSISNSKNKATSNTIASAIFTCNKPASCNHPYLIKKQIEPHGIKESDDGMLIIPIYGTDGKIQSLQFIFQDGAKRFLKGCSPARGFLSLGKHIANNPVLIVEGFATGASAYEQTEYKTYISFSAGNLFKVSEYVRAKYSDIRIIILADNDASGTGEKYAREASVNAGIEYILMPELGIDANDYVNAGGSILDLIKGLKLHE